MGENSDACVYGGTRNLILQFPTKNSSPGAMRDVRVAALFLAAFGRCGAFEALRQSRRTFRRAVYSLHSGVYCACCLRNTYMLRLCGIEYDVECSIYPSGALCWRPADRDANHAPPPPPHPLNPKP